MPQDCYSELEWRGFVHQATPGLARHLAGAPRTIYCGFDPTAPSLQVGNLLPVMLLAHLQRAGHRPIALMGGGTGLIGDPSGKRAERPLLAPEELAANLERQRAQMSRLLDFGAGPAGARLLDNAEWLVPQRLVDFLRDVGKHFTINVMLQKESVQARLEAGISYTEFSYMLLQAFDFLHLHRAHDCTVQVGGSDQWGNITAGVELIRRVTGDEAHGLVAPLVTTASGAKFGKSEAGAVWLDPARTSPYRFHQFWVNADDRDAIPWLRRFTFLPRAEIERLEAAQRADPAARPAQRALASAVTALVHGAEAAASVERAAGILFGDFDPREAGAGVWDVLARELPTTELAGDAPTPLVDAVVRAGLVKSKSEARRQIEQGGIYVNQRREAQLDRTLGPGDLLAGGHVLLRKGRKDYALLRRA